MNQSKEYIPGLLMGLCGLGVLIMSFWVDFGLPISVEVAKPVGIVVVFSGMSLVVWAAIYIREAMMGEVEPVLPVLVKKGPYTWVRHPVYCGLTIAFCGITIVLESLPGLLGVFFLFLPSVVYRAHLEEEALTRKFGTEWETYRKQTGFFLPL